MQKSSTLTKIAKWSILYFITYIFLAILLFIPFILIGRVLADLNDWTYGIHYVGIGGLCPYSFNLILSFYVTNHINELLNIRTSEI